MRYVIAGASGFLGHPLRDHLARTGHEVVRLVRGEPMSRQESRWDPYSGQVDQSVIEAADVVVNLAGAPVTHWPFTKGYQRTFTASRVATTRTLAEAVAKSTRKPALLAQNGTAGYGDHGDRVVTEESPTDADTFMGGVTRAWEQAADPAREAGGRVVIARSGPILHQRGGAFRLIKLVFSAGLGAPVGSGDQYFPTMSLRDWVRATVRLAEDEQASGAYNLVGPDTTTNAEFGRALAQMLHRPFVMRVPGWPVDKLLGPISSEVLGSCRVEPRRLLEEGFGFDDPTVNARLAAALTG